MSIRTTAASAALATLVSGVALTLASSYLPLLSAQEPTGSPLHWIRATRQAEGTVQLEVTVGSSGEVLDARVVSGPDELRSQALQSALTWRHTKDAAARRVLPVTIDFKKATGPIGGIAGGIIGGVPAPPAPPLPPSIDQAVFEGVDYQGLSATLQPSVIGVMGTLQSGQRIANTQLDQLRASLAAIDPALRIGVAMRKNSGDQDVKLRLHVSNQPAAPPQQIRIGGQVQAANLIHQVNPEYPAVAREARIQGTVRFNVSISKEGLVENLRVESGHPLLVQSAMEAVRQWKYRPVLLNGLPVAVQTVVDVNFTLSI